jgi:nucleotide-binding universal stress UspA family protein
MASEVAELALEAQPVFARVFVPIDYSNESQRAFGIALELQRIYGSAICLFHMGESDSSEEFLGGLGGAVYHDWAHQTEERLRRFVEHVAPGANVEYRVTFDPDSKEMLIRDEAESWGATLVIIADRVGKSIFRSVAENVLRTSKIPIFVLREEEPAPIED